MRRIASGAIYILSTMIGIVAFAYPFFTDLGTTGAIGIAHGEDALLITAVLVGLSLAALSVEIQGQAMSAKTVALLGVMVATASALRFIEVIVPVPGGFSPIFVPIILAGYVFGARFGFLMGAFTLLVSGLVTGGVGPWLPYQMFAAGWAGLTAGWLRRPAGAGGRGVGLRAVDLVLLTAFGFFWGLLYGAVMNVYFWPFAGGTAEQTWAPGIGLGEALARYGAFYAVTSLGWDLVRAGGNVVLILLLAAPTVKALARFQRRFHFDVVAGRD